MLHGLGRFCVRYRWLVIIVWVAAIIGGSMVIGKVGAITNNDLSLPGTGSQAATDLLTKYFPPQENGSSPVVFYSKGKVQDGGKNQKAITDTYNELKKVKHVYSVMNPFENSAAGLVSKDGHYAFIPVVLDVSSGTLSTATAQNVFDVGVKDGRAAGMKVDVGGVVGSTLGTQSTESSEIIGLIAAMIILAFTFTTMVAMGLPILAAVFGLLVGSTLIGLMGHFTSIPSIGPTLATMIGLGVGIDYALFLITKHQILMREHGLRARKSIPEMLATSGGAVLFAGSTVIVALLALAVAQIPFITSLGYACAVGVFTAVLAGLTLLPAILAVLGDSVNRGRIPLISRPKKDPTKLGMWGHWANSVVDHPVRSCVISLLVLAVMIVPVFTLVLGQEDIGTTALKTTERQAFDMVSDGFGPGYNGPLVVAFTLDPVAKPSAEYTEQYNQAQAMQADLEQQQATLTAQASALQAQQTKLEQQANALKSQAATLEAQSKKLAGQAVSLRKTEAGLRLQEGQLTREARRLAERSKVLTAQVANLTAHQATLEAEHVTLQADLAEVANALANTSGISPAVQGALLKAEERLTEADAAVQKVIAAGASQASNVQKRLAVLSKQEQNYAKRAAEIGAKADLVAAEAASIEKQSIALHAQAASLQKQAAVLQKQAASLQQQADSLKQQQAAAEAEQQQALDLKDQLTAEMTKAGGDDRGTDPRIVKLQDALAKPADVQRVVQPMINKAGNAVILSVISKSRPAARDTADLVHQLRDTTIPKATSPDMVVYVGGTTAGNVDLAALITSKLPTVILVVLALSFLLLLLAFRSLLIPVQASITNLLSATASFGILTACFQWGWGLDLINLDSPYGTVPIASYVPLMMFAALFGLSMDYEVFFISTVQGFHAKGMSHEDAMRAGLATSARVVFAAALIMMSVFGSFILIDDPIIKQFGVGLTVAVALAAFLVLFLAPAMLMLFGKRTWSLPGFLDKIIPDLDLEGNKRSIPEGTPEA
jgi:uncharacterized membrane protein YdfJ with MMPL/SSD domain